MITDRANFALLRIPSLWDVPRFEFGQPVAFEGNPGIVTGLHWVSQTSPVFLRLEAEPGWWVEVTYTEDSRYARTMISEYLHESVVQPSNSGDTSVELSSDQRHTANSLCCVEGS